jgi:uncharacterized protein YjbJ (UPF0337 family)
VAGNHPAGKGVTPMSEQTDKISGRAKQAAGDLTDDDDLRREGEVEERSGKVKESLRSAKDKVEEKVDQAKEAVEDRLNR